jgi:glycerate-2-kinase
VYYFLIKNLQSLLSNARNDQDRKARKIALEILESTLQASNPKDLVKKQVQLKGNLLQIASFTINLDEYDRIYVIGAGKASGAMAEAINDVLQKRITNGFINIPRGTTQNLKIGCITLNQAGHPIPDKAGVKGARCVIKLLEDVKENDLIISLISGGGSALLPLPADNITLTEMQSVTNNLLKCGAIIDEINIVRKHISNIKGGRLAMKVFPATLVSLIISDVVGDHLPSIASGLTVPDPSTYLDAVEILKRYGIWEKIPQNVNLHLNNGLKGKVPESPKPGDPSFKKVYNILLGSNRIALKTAREKAKQLRLIPIVLSAFMEGEARHVGTVFSSLARETVLSESFLHKPTVILAGGETTVTVRGHGKGGRNQELVLSASLRINKLEGVVIASIGTDGVDGPTDAAGALVDGSTLKRARERGMNPLDYLANNDSYSFFMNLNDLIMTGPTGTNINDLIILVSI